MNIREIALNHANHNDPGQLAEEVIQRASVYLEFLIAQDEVIVKPDVQEPTEFIQDQ